MKSDGHPRPKHWTIDLRPLGLDNPQHKIVANPHHLIPGNESLKKATTLLPWIFGDEGKIENDIGYNVNNASNGVWLPSNNSMRGHSYWIDWEDRALLEATPLPPGESSWRLGRPFKAPPQTPIEIEMDPTHSADMIQLNKKDALIMSKTMLAALREAGVDNLDAYDAVIRHPRSGFVTNDYVACNLMGLVAAADIGMSKVEGGSSDHLLDTDFEGTKIDEARAHQYLARAPIQPPQVVLQDLALFRVARQRGLQAVDMLFGRADVDRDLQGLVLAEGHLDALGEECGEARVVMRRDPTPVLGRAMRWMPTIGQRGTLRLARVRRHPLAGVRAKEK